MVTIPWRTGVNVRAFAYYGTPAYPHTTADLQIEQLTRLRDLKAKVVRLFACRHDHSPEATIRQLRAALDRIDEFGLEAIVCLDDSLTGSGFHLPGTDRFHTQVDGHLDLSYWMDEKYNDTYMPHVRAVAGAVADHPALLMWELGNEYALHPRPSAQHPEIPEPRAEQSQAFLKFARAASELLKEVAPDVLVSTGLINSRQVASLVDDDLDDFAMRLYGIETIDAISLHYYSDTENDFGEKQFGKHDLKAANALGKPAYIGEIGALHTRPNRPEFFKREFQEWRDINDRAENSVFAVMPWEFDTSPLDVGVSDNRATARIFPDFDAIMGVFASFSADVPRWKATAAAGAFRAQKADAAGGASQLNAEPEGENLLQNPGLSGFPAQPVTFSNHGSTGFIEWPDQWQWLRRDKEGFPSPESFHRDEGYEISAGSREWEMGYSQQVQVRAGRRYRLTATLTPQLGRFDNNPIHGPFLEWRFEIHGDGLDEASAWASVEAPALKQRRQHEFEFLAPADMPVTVAFVGRGTAGDYIYNFFVHRVEMVALAQPATAEPEARAMKRREPMPAEPDAAMRNRIAEPEMSGGQAAEMDVNGLPVEGWRKALASRVGAGATLVRPTPDRGGAPVGSIDMNLPVDYAPATRAPDKELPERFWTPVRTEQWQGWVRDDVISFVEVAEPQAVLEPDPRLKLKAEAPPRPRLIEFEYFGSEADALALRQKIASAPRAFSAHVAAFAPPQTETPSILRIFNHVPEVDLNTLPGRDSLFERLPISLDAIEWFQYFGNNCFAYNLRCDGDLSYNYSQSLHGGLDFGSDTPGKVVVAGLHGVVKSVSKNSTVYSPNFATITVDFAGTGISYSVIYGHLVNLRELSKDAPVFPDTEIGEIDTGDQGHMNHLHLEVRFGNWIINPLLLMPPALRDPLIARFQPFDQYFYRSDVWDKWQDPFDQPALKLSRKDSAKIIGPHAIT